MCAAVIAFRYGAEYSQGSGHSGPQTRKHAGTITMFENLLAGLAAAALLIFLISALLFPEHV